MWIKDIKKQAELKIRIGAIGFVILILGVVFLTIINRYGYTYVLLNYSYLILIVLTVIYITKAEK